MNVDNAERKGFTSPVQRTIQTFLLFLTHEAETTRVFESGSDSLFRI